MKTFSKVVLALYLLLLLWLVLFKFSYDVSSVLHIQIRNLNLIPFADPDQTSLENHLKEIISNVIVFVPFGLLLAVNLKQTNVWRKLIIVFIFSLTAEILQYILAIGKTDITDVITNTFGGFIGLVLYGFCSKFLGNKIVDRCIVISGTILFILFLWLRIFELKVRY